MTRLDSHAWSIAAAAALLACGTATPEPQTQFMDVDDGTGTAGATTRPADEGGASTGAAAGDSAGMAAGPDTTGNGEGAGTIDSADDSGPRMDTHSGTGTGDDGETAAPSSTGLSEGVVYAEDFEGPNGSAWPAPWMEAGTAIVSSDLSAGRGRMAGETTTVGRMTAPGFDVLDLDASVTVTFNNFAVQGFGFYVRHNGGALLQTKPAGEGYAVFVEGHGQPALGVWRETNGVEELLAQITAPLDGGAVSGVPYRIRFSCQQAGAETILRAKIWLVGQPEPAQWQLEHADATPQLQDVSGSFAVDIYNYSGTDSIYVDDMIIEQL